MRLSIKIITFIFSVVPLYASSLADINLLMRTKQMSIYGVKSEDRNTTNGVGLFYNTQNLKVKVEGSGTAFKTGAVVTYNPFRTSTYINIGANYINENLPENDSISNNFNQYSSAVAVGYMLYNDLYVELGENISRLNGYQILEDNKASSQITKDTYSQIGKRFETPIGTIDTHLNSSQIYNTLTAKEENYESSINYYLNDAIKVGYSYRMNQNKICNGYSIDFNYLSTEYTKNIAQDSYNITVGLKANFTDITNFSTYKPTSKVKKHLSKSHKFDNIILQKNMHLRK